MPTESSHVETRPGTIAPDVAKRIAALDLDSPKATTWILPTITRDGTTHYDPSEVDSLRFAKESNLDAAYIVPADERTYIEEFAAGWVLEFAMAVMQNLTADLAVSLGTYVLRRAKQAVLAGHHGGPTGLVPVKLTLAHYERSADGTTVLENLEIHGNANGVVAAIQALVAPPEIESAKAAGYVDGTVTNE